ncbi:MAG: OpgC domain-containing protein, partial [Hyphomicrobiales bacterium]|nr:OpgC domain-containing protein [Hyphomicrobiales bacterium]
LISGLRAVALTCLARAWRIYGVHLALTFCGLIIFGACYQFTGLSSLIEAHGRTVMFHQPVQGTVGVALLTHQLGYFNILPLYVVLMAISPLILALAKIEPALALLASGAAYLAVRPFGMHLPNWPEPGGWFLNPFAWQLVFTLGVLAAIRWREDALKRSWLLWSVCAVVTAAGAIIVSDGFGLMPGLHDRVFVGFDVGKQNLGFARLVNFLALAYLIATSPLFVRFGRTRVGEALQSLGRHSLPIFAASSVLSAIGQAGLAASGQIVSEDVVKGLGFGYTLLSIGGLFALASYLEWRRAVAKTLLYDAPGGDRSQQNLPSPV